MGAGPPKQFTPSCLGNLAAGEATVATGFKVSQIRLNRQFGVDLRGREGGGGATTSSVPQSDHLNSGRPGVNNNAGGLDGAERD
jgi:hypothetical protein